MIGKRVALLTYGTRGDVEPFLALAVRLRRCGFEPRLAAPEVFESMVRKLEVEFWPLPGDPFRLANDLVGFAGASWPRMVAAVSRHVLPLAAQVSRRAADCAAGVDLVVHSFLMLQAGHELAVRQHLPSVSAQLFPVFAPTASFPSVVSPDLPLGGLYRRWTHTFVTMVFWHGSRILYGRLRRLEPGLPPLTGWPFSAPREVRPTLLFAFSQHVVPPPPDWSGVAEVSGYWRLGMQESTWTPTKDLARFLEQDAAPVYVGLGSGSAAARGSWITHARAALEENGLRGVLDVGSLDPAQVSLPATMMAVRDVPHAWLFPRVAAVVHHGGAGTTGAGLAAGRPTVIVPATSDQPFWGRRVHALGVGPAPIALRKLTAAKLTQAISVAVTDGAMRHAAEELGKRIEAEDGVGIAVQRVAELLGRSHTA